MSELLSRYQEAVHDLFRKVESTQQENIVKAGEMIADCVLAGGAVHLSDICHMIEFDLLNRGGGVAFYKRFHYDLTVDNKVRDRDRSGADASIEGLARYALNASKALPGDIMVVSSVSGRTPRTVDLAWESKKMGLKVIALLSMEYARAVDATHSSGIKLYDMVDLVLDNCAPAAEAMLDVEGLDARFAAASGLSSAYILWSATAIAVESMMKRGVTPVVFKSVNYPGGPAHYEQAVKTYQERGY
jgi:uncharacterized phosphosugar-binding protein